MLSFEDIFAGPDDSLGRTSLLKHTIDTGTAPPIRQPVRRISPSKRQEVSQLLESMLKKDVIQQSSSPWASLIVLVQKKDGSTRFCMDYRKLNSVTRKDAYPLPRIDDTLDTLHALDLASGYWQVELTKEDQHRIAFCTTHGLYEFKVMPFSLCNAPATFQRLMDLVLTGLLWSSCLVYLDDIIVLGKNFTDHLQNINLVFQRIRDAGLKLQPPKCRFFQEEVAYLEHIVSRDGISVDPTKIDKVRHWPIPQNSKDVQQFLGLANYYRRFILGFAELAKPLHRLMPPSPGRKNAKNNLMIFVINLHQRLSLHTQTLNSPLSLTQTLVIAVLELCYVNMLLHMEAGCSQNLKDGIVLRAVNC